MLPTYLIFPEEQDLLPLTVTDINSLSLGSMEHTDQTASLGFVTTNGNGW